MEGLVRLRCGQRRRTCWKANSLILVTKIEDLPESQFTCVESQLAYPGDKGGPARGPVRLSWGQRRRNCRRASPLVWRANSLILGTKKEDLLEGQFGTKKEDLPESQLILRTKKEDLLEGKFAYPGEKARGPAGEPVRLSWKADSLILGTKKEDLLRASSLIVGTKKEDLPESKFACVESQFAYPGDKEGGPKGPAGESVRLCGEPIRLSGDKEGGPAEGPVRLLWGQSRRICWRASSLILGRASSLVWIFKPIRLSWGQRRRTCWRASSLMLGTKKEDLLEGQFAYPGDKEGRPAGEPVRLCGGHIRLSWGQRRRTCWRASSLILGTKKEDLPESQLS